MLIAVEEMLENDNDDIHHIRSIEAIETDPTEDPAIKIKMEEEIKKLKSELESKDDELGKWSAKMVECYS